MAFAALYRRNLLRLKRRSHRNVKHRNPETPQAQNGEALNEVKREHRNPETASAIET